MFLDHDFKVLVYIAVCIIALNINILFSLPQQFCETLKGVTVYAFGCSICSLFCTVLFTFLYSTALLQYFFALIFTVTLSL